VRIVVDAQLPPALADWLTARGHDAVHVYGLGFARASDPEIWQHALDTSAVIISKDEDFATLAQLRPNGPPIVWVRFGNVRRSDLLARMEELWPRVLEALERGETLVELA
jgi:predicted nuclease of predicted toxin-antitoxin system